MNLCPASLESANDINRRTIEGVSINGTFSRGTISRHLSSPFASTNTGPTVSCHIAIQPWPVEVIQDLVLRAPVIESWPLTSRIRAMNLVGPLVCN
ncbi:hypothetical protein PoB_001035900 [Plakobranchus ocellatus]|uniref:Uncharacterized protein n=1 Tax=Plakobranchus ocellatus TaxID=259542 RepID=A0AAV3YP02_9GAST|nr:hypothetical protein PoB_001035900 [Plakobranchus ocellatus]